MEKGNAENKDLIKIFEDMNEKFKKPQPIYITGSLEFIEKFQEGMKEYEKSLENKKK